MKFISRDREAINDLIIKLRHQNQKDNQFKYASMTYKNISYFVKKSPEYCRQIVLDYIKRRKAFYEEKVVITTRKNMIKKL